MNVVGSVIISNLLRKAGVDGDTLRKCMLLPSDANQHHAESFNDIGKLASKEKIHFTIISLRPHFTFNSDDISV